MFSVENTFLDKSLVSQNIKKGISKGNIELVYLNIKHS